MKKNRNKEIDLKKETNKKRKRKTLRVAGIYTSACALVVGGIIGIGYGMANANVSNGITIMGPTGIVTSANWLQNTAASYTMNATTMKGLEISRNTQYDGMSPTSTSNLLFNNNYWGDTNKQLTIEMYNQPMWMATTTDSGYELSPDVDPGNGDYISGGNANGQQAPNGPSAPWIYTYNTTFGWGIADRAYEAQYQWLNQTNYSYRFYLRGYDNDQTYDPGNINNSNANNASGTVPFTDAATQPNSATPYTTNSEIYSNFMNKDGWSVSPNSSESYVTPSDFVANSLFQMYYQSASPSLYIYQDYSNLMGYNQKNSEQSSSWMQEQTILANTGTKTINAQTTNNWSNMKLMLYNAGESPTWNQDHGFASSWEDAGLMWNNQEGWIQYNTDEYNPTFITMLTGPAWWPLDYQYIEANPQMKNPGVIYSSPSTSPTDGAFKYSYMNPLYGYTLIPSSTFFNPNVVSTPSISYRATNETSTIVSQFDLDQATATYGVSAQQLALNSETSQWMSPIITSPEIGGIYFNLSPLNDSANSVYDKDANFRRSMFYAYDQTYSNQLGGTPSYLPAYLFSSYGMQSFTNPTGVGETADATQLANTISYSDAMTNYQYEYPTGESNGTTETKQMQLNYVSSTARNESYSQTIGSQNFTTGTLNGETSFNPYQDQLFDKTMSQYYYNQFVNDMNAIGYTGYVPTIANYGHEKDITLTYLVDEVGTYQYQSWNTTLAQDHIPIQIEPEVVPGTSFYATMFNPESTFDLVSTGWLPDYQSPWSFLGMFNGTSLAKSYNASGGWTVWFGSEGTYGNTYAEGNNGFTTNETAKMNELNNDGIVNLYQDSLQPSGPSNRYTDLFGNTINENSNPSNIFYGLGTTFNYLYTLTTTTPGNDIPNINLATNKEVTIPTSVNGVSTGKYGGKTYTTPTYTSGASWSDIFLSQGTTVDLTGQQSTTSSTGINTYSPLNGGTATRNEINQLNMFAIFEILIRDGAPGVVTQLAQPMVSASKIGLAYSPNQGLYDLTTMYSLNSVPKGMPTQADYREAYGMPPIN